MNTSVEDFLRSQLKLQLALCSEAQQLMFKRMYSHNDLTLDINSVVDNMPIDKLDWALTQVERTLNK